MIKNASSWITGRCPVQKAFFQFFIFTPLLFAFSCRSFQIANVEELPPQNTIEFYFPEINQVSRLQKKLHVKPEDKFGLQSENLLRYMKDLDNQENYSFHTPTENEKKIIRSTLDRLPPLLMDNFKKRVIGVYFIDNFISSGYTDWLTDSEGNVYSVILIHSGVFQKTVSEILEKRESTCFQNDESQINVRIHAGGKENSFLYIFLHEAVHAADYSLRISDIDEKSFNTVKNSIPQLYQPMDSYWETQNAPLKKFEFPKRDKISFYGFREGPHLFMKDAPEVYSSLRKSPFVSLYGSQYRVEDLAELVTMYHLTEILGYEYSIQIIHQKYDLIFRPFQTQEVRKRIPGLQFFYAKN